MDICDFILFLTLIQALSRMNLAKIYNINKIRPILWIIICVGFSAPLNIKAQVSQLEEPIAQAEQVIEETSQTVQKTEETRSAGRMLGHPHIYNWWIDQFRMPCQQSVEHYTERACLLVWRGTVLCTGQGSVTDIGNAADDTGHAC